MKKYYLLIFIVITTVLVTQAQLSDLHYLPPLKQGNGGTGSINQQRIYLSTPEETAFDVHIYRGNSTTILATITGLDKDNSQTYNLANGNNGITLVTTANTGKVLTDAGLRFESAGGEDFYVNYRGRSGAQGTSLTSKGRPALGTLFKWGGRPNYGIGNNTLNAVLGIMAVDDDTTINIFGYDTDCSFRDGSDADGILDDNLTITLDAGESYVLEAPRNNSSANIDCWLGATIQSDKKIAVSNGNLNGASLQTSNNRDAGIDQPVPENVLGREYVFVRANGTDVNETPIIIGTQNGTEIYVNGNATSIATLNNGDYYVIPGSNYSSGIAGGNMYVTTSKEVYAYQYIAGSTANQTGGLNFIAPVNCLMPPTFDNIHNIRDVAGLNYTGGITITASTATPDGNIEVIDGTGPVTLPSSIAVTGTSDWKTFVVTNLSGDVKVTSTGPIAVGFFGVNSSAGIAGYFSGFDTVPIVELDITGGGCLPGSDVYEVTGGFDAYQWFENGAEIVGETTNTYTPSGPGDFFVRVRRGSCTYDSGILSAYNCDPEIVITKTADTNTVIEGDVVTFTIMVEHLGVNPVSNLVINDILPTELSFSDATASFGSWIAPNWTIGDMYSGEVHTLTLEAIVNEVSTGSIVTNTISNTQDQVEANALTDDPTEDITIVNNELELTKTDRAPTDGSYDTVGEIITYDFVVTNTGDQVIPNVTISDPNIDSGSLIPASVTNLGVGDSASFTATHTITQDDIEADQVVNSATALGTLSNGFIISDISDDPDDLTSMTSDPTVTLIDQKGALVLEKIALPAPDGLYDNMVGGSPAVEQITYEFTVINTGNVSLDNITISDSNIDMGSLSPSSVANLPAGESTVFTAAHTIVSLDFTNGNVTNSATASGTESVEGTMVSDISDDPTTVAPDDSTVVGIPQFGQLEVTKVDDEPTNGPYNTVGQVITYTIFVTNIGNVPITDVNVVDPNADTVTLISTTGTDDGVDDVVDLLEPMSISPSAPAQTATFEATHTITQEDLDAGEVVNTATVGGQDPSSGSITDLSDDPDDITSSIDDPTIVPLGTTVGLSVTKEADDTNNVLEGQTVTYTYVVTNTGNVTFDDVSISDIHSGNGTLVGPELQTTTGTDTDNSDNEVDELGPGDIATWTATYLITSTDVSNQSDITNIVTATATPRTGSLTDPTANELVSVHPVEAICSEDTLAHDLTLDVDPAVVTFSWEAEENDLVTGETTSTSSTSSITDTLVNVTNLDQEVIYTIRGYDIGGVLLDEYTYIVTVQKTPLVLSNPTSTICSGDTQNRNLISNIDNFNDDVSFSWIAADNPDVTGETISTSTDDSITDTLVNTTTTPQDVVYTITPTAISNGCTGTIYQITVTVNPLPIGTSSTERICSDEELAYDLDNIVDLSGSDFSWVATNNVNVTGESLVANDSGIISDSLNNASGVLQDVVYTVTPTSSDGCEGSIFTVTVTVEPELDLPPNDTETVECLASAVQPSTPLVQDINGVTIVPTITENTDPVCEGEKIYTFTYVDCAGNDNIYTYTYTIDTTILPGIPPNTASTVECLADAIQPTAPTVTDACGRTITPLIAENPDITCEGEKVFAFLYRDCSDNISTYIHTYTIDLTTPPDVPANAGSTVSCLADALQPTAPVVVDACNVAITPVITENTDPVCEGSKIYTFTYTDCAGNASAYVYTYTIDLTTPPDVPVGAGSTVECLSDAVQPTAPVVVDACDVAITPVITENTDPVCEGSKIYTFTYTDCAGNASAYVYTYTIDTTTSPDVPLDAGSTVECLVDAVQPTAPVVLDACDVAITPVITENTDPVCEGSKIYTFTYTDCAGNVSAYVYTYTIDTTTPPDVPANAGSTVACLSDAVQPTAPVVLDACDVAITPVITENTDPLCEGSKIYTFTYTDCAGNASAYVYTYTIDTTTSPDVPVDAGSTVECLSDAVQPAAPVVLDACDVAITPVITENTDPLCEGSKIYTFTYTDCAGNASAYVYTYTIDTTTSPDVPADAGSTVECLVDAVQPTAPVVLDACDVAITPVITENTDPLCEGSKIYTFTYTDCAGNASAYVYTYTIDTTTSPDVPVDAGSTVECLSDAVQPAAPVVLDACDVAITPVITENTDPVCEGSKIYTFTYTDCAGNVSAYVYTYTIDLTTPPDVPVDAGSTVECLSDAVQPAAPVVLDACDVAITPVITENTDPVCEGSKIYTFTYTDCAGNASAYVYTYTIDTTTSPDVPVDAGSTVECLSDAVQPAAPV
ncbi:HYR-like domain-containing protein, partial [Aquimarina pacifica]|uniref:HYR-like domain-containing protein n=1 Tax=Aquimarina pacifica TaxID=1296415 RepID=UPI000470B2DF